METNTLAKAIDCLANNLSQAELVALNRRIRAFRLGIIVLLVATLTLGGLTLFPKSSKFAVENIYICGSSLSSWHSFQILVVITVLVPTLLIFYLTSTLTSVNNPIHEKIQPKSLPTWMEFLIVILAGAVVTGFWGGLRFVIQ